MKTYAYLLIVLLCFGAACAEGDNAAENVGNQSISPECRDIFADKLSSDELLSVINEENIVNPGDAISINDVDGTVEPFTGTLANSLVDQDDKEITHFVVTKTGPPEVNCDGRIEKAGDSEVLILSCGVDGVAINCDAEYSLGEDDKFSL